MPDLCVTVFVLWPSLFQCTTHDTKTFSDFEINSETTDPCRDACIKMIIGRNERRGTRRLSHLQENAQNDVEEFSWEQGCPLFACFCRPSGLLLFAISSRCASLRAHILTIPFHIFHLRMKLYLLKMKVVMITF